MSAVTRASTASLAVCGARVAASLAAVCALERRATCDAGMPIARVAKAIARIDFGLIMRWVTRPKAAIETPGYSAPKTGLGIGLTSEVSRFGSVPGDEFEVGIQKFAGGANSLAIEDLPRGWRPSMKSQSEKTPNLGEPCLRIGLAQLDQPFDIVGLEHHEAQHVVRAGLAGAETACEKAKGARQIRFIGVRQSPQVLRRPEHEQFDAPEAVA